MTTTSTGAPCASRSEQRREDGGDAVHIALDRATTRPRGGSTELTLTAIVEPEDLVRVAMLLVVVDEPGIRRRREDRVEGASEHDLGRVAVDDLGGVPPSTHALEGLQPVERVDEVAAQELVCLLHGRAGAAVLVAPVGLALRRAREVEVEVRGQPRRSCGPREHDAKDVGVLVVLEERAKVKELSRGVRREPLADEAGRPFWRPAAARQRAAHVGLEPERVVLGGLHAHQQAVERRDVDADSVVARLEALHERRPRSGERVEDAPTRLHVAKEQSLDELRDELAEVRVQTVHVLRALALGKLRLRPGEVEIAREVVVERSLRRSH